VLLDELRQRHTVDLRSQERERERETARHTDQIDGTRERERDQGMYLPALVTLDLQGGHAVTAAAAHREHAGPVGDALPLDPGALLQARVER
jgi:hypothetical protein